MISVLFWKSHSVESSPELLKVLWPPSELKADAYN